MCLQRLFEKCCEKHKDSLNLILHIIAFIVFIYGLWVHSLEWILVAALIAVLGHIIEEINKKRALKKVKKEKPAKRKRKKGALEMSIGTIVIMVIAVTMLILGIVFVRNVMCTGMQMTDDIGSGVQAQIRDLFSGSDYGVKCTGEDASEFKVGSGGRRALGCIIKSEYSAEYNIQLSEIKSLEGASTEEVEGWVLKDNWEGDVTPGGNGKAVVAVLLNVPRDAPTTVLQIKLKSTNSKTSSNETHELIIDVVPTNFVTDTMC